MNDKAYENLANAIIQLAADDYKKAVIKLKKSPHNSIARGTIESTLKFFRSDWYRQLTNLDSETLIRMLNEEVKK